MHELKVLHELKVYGGEMLELTTKNRYWQVKKYVRNTTIILSILFILSILSLCIFYLYLKSLGPPPLTVPQSTIYYAADGTVIGESDSGQKRYWVDLQEISPSMIDATISVEDKRFYQHFGIDFKRIGGALIADMKAMAKVQGASTITQQYARNLFLEHDKSWKRKLKELVFALRLEMNYSKHTILEGYLNTINYGHGAYGVEAASQYYFGKGAKDLSLAEASMLAGIPKGPAKFSPLVSLEKATNRQQVIIQSMVKNGFIDEATALEATNEQLSFVGKHQYKRNEIAPYFQDAVFAFLKNDQALNEQAIALGGLRVYTTLDLNDQQVAEKVINEIIPKDSSLQVGFVAMNPTNGYVTAMVGGTDYEESPFNRAVQASRQPGSIMKPILFYRALEHGFTPSTTMRSEQTTFHFDDGRPPYSPRNFNHQYANGDITLAQALALSDNIYAVKTHLFLGEDSLIESAKHFGLTTTMEKVPSLALGTSEVRVIEMATAYSLFANGGKRIEPTFVKRVENHRGEVIYEHQNTTEKILDSKLAFVMTHMLTGMFDPKLNGYTSVTGQTMIKTATRPYAGKSGTTNTDSWMIGYTPQRTAVVWTGYDKDKQLELTVEKSYAKNIWVQFMEASHQNVTVKGFKAPKGTVGVYVDPSNGLLASDACPVKRLTYYVAGTEPIDFCEDHGHIHETDQPTPNKQKERLPWYKRIFQWND